MRALEADRWNVLTRALARWDVTLDGVRHEVALVQRLTLLSDVLRRDRILPDGSLTDELRLALCAPGVRYDVLVDGRSHTGPAWGHATPLARERAFRIYGHRGVVRIVPRPGLRPQAWLFVDEILVAPPAQPRPRRLGRRLAAASGAALVVLAVAALALL